MGTEGKNTSGRRAQNVVLVVFSYWEGNGFGVDICLIGIFLYFPWASTFLCNNELVLAFCYLKMKIPALKISTPGALAWGWSVWDKGKPSSHRLAVGPRVGFKAKTFSGAPGQVGEKEGCRERKISSGSGPSGNHGDVPYISVSICPSATIFSFIFVEQLKAWRYSSFILIHFLSKLYYGVRKEYATTLLYGVLCTLPGTHERESV